jgi:hypothetical protein
MLEKQDADAFAEQLAGATMRVVRDYDDEEVVGEPAFSDQLCGRLKETLEGFETETIGWQVDVTPYLKGFGRLKARTLSPWKEEPELGADIVMVLDVETPDFVVRKGFLAQAKRVESGKLIDAGEHRRLIEQCEKMLYVTPASMVFLYSTGGVHVVPAAAVLQHKGRNLYDLITYDTFTLYRDFAICWFGDPRIQATDRLTLASLRETLGVNAAVRFVGRPREPKEVDWSEPDPDWLS